MIEALIASLILCTIIVSIYGLFNLTLQLSQRAEERVVAIALANEKAEMVRNLPYKDVGTVGGVPSGAIPQSQTITRNSVNYIVKTDIRYVDDPYDGVVGGSGGNADQYSADYKQVRIDVNREGVSKNKPVLLITYVAPAGIEGSDLSGTMDFLALNTAGEGIPNAAIHLTNSAVTPAIDITTVSNSDGHVILPGLPPGNGSYKLSVTSDNYTSEQTYDSTPTFIPDTDHSHLSIILGQLTNKAFVIDRISSLNINTQDPSGQAIGNVAFGLKGTKTIGVNQVSQPVFVLDVQGTTDAAGHYARPNMVWDTYNLTVDGAQTGYDMKETSAVIPLSLHPGDANTLTVTLVPHTPLSVWTTVVAPDGTPVNNATVHLVGSGYDQTKGTGPVGQVFFSDMVTAGQYTINIDAPGYISKQDTVTINGTNRLLEQMTPAS